MTRQYEKEKTYEKGSWLLLVITIKERCEETVVKN